MPKKETEPKPKIIKLPYAGPETMAESAMAVGEFRSLEGEAREKRRQANLKYFNLDDLGRKPWDKS